MTSAHYSNQEPPNASASSDSHGGCCRKGNWSSANIFAMVLGFIIFPPLGFIVLFWSLMGHPIQTLPGAVRSKWQDFKSPGSNSTVEKSENVVFSDYQQTQYDRIRELKEEIKNRARRFKDFRHDAKRRADQEEFDRFMASKPVNEEK